jgi:hypothetical protein
MRCFDDINQNDGLVNVISKKILKRKNIPFYGITKDFDKIYETFINLVLFLVKKTSCL